MIRMGELASRNNQQLFSKTSVLTGEQR